MRVYPKTGYDIVAVFGVITWKRTVRASAVVMLTASPDSSGAGRNGYAIIYDRSCGITSRQRDCPHGSDNGGDHHGFFDPRKETTRRPPWANIWKCVFLV